MIRKMFEGSRWFSIAAVGLPLLRNPEEVFFSNVRVVYGKVISRCHVSAEGFSRASKLLGIFL